MRKSSKERFAKIKETYKIYYKDLNHISIHDIKISKVELNQIKHSIRKKLREERQLDFIKSAIVILGLIFLVYFLLV